MLEKRIRRKILDSPETGGCAVLAVGIPIAVSMVIGANVCYEPIDDETDAGLSDRYDSGIEPCQSVVGNVPGEMDCGLVASGHEYVFSCGDRDESIADQLTMGDWEIDPILARIPAWSQGGFADYLQTDCVDTLGDPECIGNEFYGGE